MSTQQRQNLDHMLRQVGLDLGGEVHELRRAFAGMMAAVPRASDVVVAPSSLGDVPISRISLRDGREHGAILYFHGGAYAIGSAELSAGLASELGRRSSAAVYSVDYRLAPENPHPAALSDAVAAYRGLLSEGVPAEQIVLAGESAGGGLALALAVRITSESLPRPAGIYLASPWVDLTTSGRSMVSHASLDPSVTPDGLRRRSVDYVGGADPGDPAVSPLFADLTGLPPMLIQVGGNEVLLEDSTRLASNAAAQGVEVTLQVTPEVPHVFVGFAGMLDEADAALDSAGAFISALSGLDAPRHAPS